MQVDAKDYAQTKQVWLTLGEWMNGAKEMRKRGRKERGMALGVAVLQIGRKKEGN